jgi:endonuclease/exonuclease/phosphatase family metal-dependent hydrolase
VAPETQASPRREASVVVRQVLVVVLYLSAHWKVHRTRVIHTELARLVSDHLPLVVEVALARVPVADVG